jgi:putative oxidoreductase
MDSGILALRLVLGLLMAAHGAQKLFGWFGGHGLAGTGGFFESLGFRPGRLFASAAGISEFGGGLLVTLGLFGAVGPALVLSVMIVAAVSVHAPNGLFAMSNGIEVPLLYGVGALALALAGAGLFSLDALLGLTPLWTSTVKWAVLIAGILGGIANLALRRKPAPAPAAA